MNNKGLNLVPDDLLIRVSRTFKDNRAEFGDTLGQHIIDCLETAKLAGEAADQDRLRRIFTVNHLEAEKLNKADSEELPKWEQAKKALMEIWDSPVGAEEVWGNIVCLTDELWKSHNKASKRERYLKDVAKLWVRTVENIKIPAEVIRVSQAILRRSLELTGAGAEG